MRPSLEPDCAACTALCCMAFAFEVGDDFAIEKQAGEACPHLASDFSCAIHSCRAERGFSGCVSFDCKGAGQRLTAEVFPGVDWRKEPRRVPRIINAFRALREVHRLMEVVDLSSRLPLNPEQAQRRSQLLARLDPEAGWSEATLSEFEGGALRADALAFLKSLRALHPGS